MTLAARVRRLEGGLLPAAELRRMVAFVAAERGLDPDELMAEVERVLAEAAEPGRRGAGAMAAHLGHDPAVLAEADDLLARWQAAEGRR